MNINSIFENELMSLESTRSDLNKELSKLPQEEIYCQFTGKYIRWFCRNNDKKYYLSKKEKAHALKLAKAKYYRAMKADIEASISIIRDCVNKLEKITAVETLMKKKTYSYLIRESLENQFYSEITSDDVLHAWAESDYLRNEKFPEKCIHSTLSGINVRSKSEALIANCLYNHQIPFRYEEKISLGEFSCCPDFSVMHPITHKVYYWEHFGMMDSQKYRNNALNKISIYGENDIFPSDNLLMTFETAKHPLGTLEVENTIKMYLL